MALPRLKAPMLTNDARFGASEAAAMTQEEAAAAGLLPSWVGDEELHLSHRSNLLAKDPEFYRGRFTELFGPEPDDLPYLWPGPDDLPPAPEPEGVRVWVARPRSRHTRAIASP